MNRLQIVAVAAAVPALSFLLSALPANAQTPTHPGTTKVTVESIAPATGSRIPLVLVTENGNQFPRADVPIVLRHSYYIQGSPNQTRSVTMGVTIGYDGYNSPGTSLPENITCDTLGQWQKSFESELDPPARFGNTGFHVTSGSSTMYVSGDYQYYSQSLVDPRQRTGPLVPLINDGDVFEIYVPSSPNPYITSVPVSKDETPLVPFRRDAHYAAR